MLQSCDVWVFANKKKSSFCVSCLTFIFSYRHFPPVPDLSHFCPTPPPPRDSPEPRQRRSCLKFKDVKGLHGSYRRWCSVWIYSSERQHFLNSPTVATMSRWSVTPSAVAAVLWQFNLLWLCCCLRTHSSVLLPLTSLQHWFCHTGGGFRFNPLGVTCPWVDVSCRAGDRNDEEWSPDQKYFVLIIIINNSPNF